MRIKVFAFHSYKIRIAIRVSLVFAAISPHPPIIVPTIGSPADLKKVEKTIGGMEKLAQKIAESKPETVLVISPHGPVDFYQFSIITSPTLAGHFYHFGDFKTELIFKSDQNLISLIEKEAKRLNIPLRLVNQKELDHGTLVPLYFLSQGLPNIKVVPLAFSYLDLETHFKLGKMLQEIINKSQEARIGIVASGDLSHRLTPDAPAGYTPKGKEFDNLLIDLLKTTTRPPHPPTRQKAGGPLKAIKGILNMEPNLVEEAGECGYRSIIILLGALNGLDWQPEILSYEGPFGVGYLATNFKLKNV